MYNLTKQNPIIVAFSAAATMMLTGAMMYLLLEPTSMLAASDTDSFVVSQTIDAEISFAAPTSDIAIAGTIGGATGGTTNGSTTVGITTNNTSGYTLTMYFEDANGMQSPTASTYISYYGSTTPSYDFTPGTATTAIAYSASGTNVASGFLNNGSSCGSGTASYQQCFMVHTDPSNSGAAETIAASTGSVTNDQTVISFRVFAAPNSGLENGIYYATTTLTATTN